MWVDFVIKKILGIQGSELKEYFDDIELEKVVPKLLQYMFEIAHCQNVHWISKEEWVGLHLKDPNDGRDELTRQIYNNISIQSLVPASLDEIQKLLERFSPQSRLPQLINDNSLSSLVVPVRSFKTGEPLAYLLFTGVQHKRPERVLSRISRDLGFMERHLNYAISYWEVQKQSLMDDLTGLFNQRHMVSVLENEIYRSQREKAKFSVLFMDIDYFKSVNDTRGHLVGSRLLFEIGALLKEKLRKSDFAFRYGGDEFVVVLPHTDAEQAMVVAERLRSYIEKTNFMVEGLELRLTISIGLATFPDHAKTYKDIIKMADEAMYCGKNKSRNIVFVAS